MKKKFSWFMVLLLLAITVVSGCSSSNSNSESKSENESGSTSVVNLKYWVPFSGGDGEFMEELVNEFNSTHEDIQVEMLNIEWDNYYTKLRTSLISKSGPDVAIAHASKLAELVPTGMVEPIDTVAGEAGIDWATYTDNQVSAVTIDDKRYAVPLDTHALIMYYNKDYLGDAGLLDENENIVMDPGVDGFVSMLETLQGKLPEGVFPFASNTDNVYPFWTWYALNSQNGGSYIEDGKAAFNNEAGKQALQVLVDMVDKGVWPKNVTNGYDLFKSGKSAVNFAGVWATGNYEKNEELNFGAVPFPTLFGEASAWGDSHTLILPVQDNTEKQVAAARFSDWLAENGAKWAVAGHVPSKQSVLDSEEYQSLEYRPGYAEVTQYVDYMPRSEKLWSANDIMIDNFTMLLNGKMTVEEALKKAENDVNNLLSK
jgi:multiple sugar transport system substrate-binding protein